MLASCYFDALFTGTIYRAPVDLRFSKSIKVSIKNRQTNEEKKRNLELCPLLAFSAINSLKLYCNIRETTFNLALSYIDDSNIVGKDLFFLEK